MIKSKRKPTRYYVSPYVIFPLIFAGLTLLAALVAMELPKWYPPWQVGSRWAILLWILVLGLLGAGCGALVVRFFLTPLERLVKEAEKLPSVGAAAGQDAGGEENELGRISTLLEQVTRALGKVEAQELFPEIIGHSRAMRSIMGQVLKVAPTDAGVLITGESGTGKELLADAIHRLSRRKDKPFIKLNCVAIPEGLLESELFGHEKGAFTGAAERRKGKFELADGGTLLLDEIGDMPLATQAKILRVLQEQEFERVGGSRSLRVDVRILAATNRDLEPMIKEGRFRQDLYFRLNVFNLHLPALKERKEDIPLLVEHFLGSGPEAPQISDLALQLLMAYSWPGNVRELHNVVERCAVLCEEGRVEPHHLPPQVNRGLLRAPPPAADKELQRPLSVDEQLREIEKGIILEALRKSGGVQVRAAELLGIKERSLWHRIKKYEIDVSRMRSEREG